MSLIAFNCAHCGKRARKQSGGVNRSRRNGYPLYCSRRCSGLARRKHKTKAQKVEEKRLYDIEYSRRNATVLKAKRAAYHRRTYDPVKAAIERKKNMLRHIEYCRRPEYKEWKRWYDADLRAKEYGEFAEAYRAVLELNREIKQRVTNHEIKYQNQATNKAQRRRRAG